MITNIPNAQIESYSGKTKIKFEGFDSKNYEISVLTEKPRKSPRRARFFELVVRIDHEIKKIWIHKKNFQKRFSKDDLAARFLVQYFPHLTSVLKKKFFLTDPPEKHRRLTALYSTPPPPPEIDRINLIKQAIQTHSPHTELSEADIIQFCRRADLAVKEGYINTKLEVSKSKTRTNPHGRSILIGPNGEKYLLLTRTLKMDDRKCGNGEYKDIKMAINLENGAIKALAIFDKKKFIKNQASKFFSEFELNMRATEELAYCKKEIQTMGLCNNIEEIVHIEAAFSLKDKCYIIMDYCNGGDLRKRINENDLNQKDEWILDIAKGLEKIHKKNIIHCDIKPENILIHDDHAKIIDFGLSVQGNCQGVVGTPGYIAPEVLKRGEITPKFDVYGFGCVVYELLTRKQYKAGIHDFFNEKYRILLENTLHPDPEKRWDMTQVLTHLNTGI